MNDIARLKRSACRSRDHIEIPGEAVSGFSRKVALVLRLRKRLNADYCAGGTAFWTSFVRSYSFAISSSNTSSRL